MKGLCKKRKKEKKKSTYSHPLYNRCITETVI